MLVARASGSMFLYFPPSFDPHHPPPPAPTPAFPSYAKPRRCLGLAECSHPPGGECCICLEPAAWKKLPAQLLRNNERGREAGGGLATSVYSINGKK